MPDSFRGMMQRRIMRNLHQIYDTPIFQVRQTFQRKTFEKSFVFATKEACRNGGFCNISCNYAGAALHHAGWVEHAIKTTDVTM
jgi:hypothetical protein